MENQVKVFESAEFGSVRTIDLNGVPYFVGKDVASILGYKLERKAISDHVDTDDVLKWNVTDNLGREQETTLINESGLYSLILGSKLPNAKKFKRWVTNEVLPIIRKTGGYGNYNDLVERISLLEPKQAKHCAYLEVRKDEFKKLNEDYGSLQDYCKSLEKRIRILEKDHPISKYSKTLDSAERFIHEWIIIPIQYNELRIEKNVLYNYYVEWCYNNGFLPYSKSKFTQILENEFNTRYVTIKDLTIKEYGKTYYKLAIVKKT